MINRRFFLQALFFLLLLEGRVLQANSLYQLENSPYASAIASKEGDILTVVVEEKAETEDSGKNDESKKQEMDFELGKFFIPHFKPNIGFDDAISEGDKPGVNFGSEDKFTSSSQRDSGHSITTKFQVRIVEKASKDQFVIRGQRLVTIEGKDKRIYLSGLIRQDDIKDDNTIESHLIADAVIEIDGEVVSRDLKPGYIGSVLKKIFF